MISLAELTSRISQLGRVVALFSRPVRLEAVQSVERIELDESGVQGDHGRGGKRGVTLIQAEHIPVIASLAGLSELDPAILRRNIVVSGLNLGAFRGKQLKIGSALVELSIPCAPCSRMEKSLGFGAYTAMRGHGGWCAQVIEPGTVQLDDALAPLGAKVQE